jgi:hypothetical protein
VLPSMVEAENVSNHPHTPSDIHRRLSEFCRGKPHAGSTVFSQLRSFYSGQQTEPAGVRVWYGDTPREWFSEAIRKLKGMATIYNLEVTMLS